MKRLLKIIEDNGIQIIEIIISIFVLIIPKIFNIKGMFSDYLKANIIEPDNVFYILLLGSSNVVIGIVLCVIVLRIFRKHNHDSVMMNRVNTYHSYPYWWFWFSAKVVMAFSLITMLVAVASLILQILTGLNIKLF